MPGGYSGNFTGTVGALGNKPVDRSVDEIIAALLEECKDCSERSSCDAGTPLIYCPTRDAAAKLKELNDFENSQCAKLLTKLDAANIRIANLECQNGKVEMIGRAMQDCIYNIDDALSRGKRAIDKAWSHDPLRED